MVSDVCADVIIEGAIGPEISSDVGGDVVPNMLSDDAIGPNISSDVGGDNGAISLDIVSDIISDIIRGGKVVPGIGSDVGIDSIRPNGNVAGEQRGSARHCHLLWPSMAARQRRLRANGDTASLGEFGVCDAHQAICHDDNLQRPKHPASPGAGPPHWQPES